MWMSLCVSRRICLLTLAGVMLVSASKVDALLRLPCCTSGGFYTSEAIMECFKQEPRVGCRSSDYLVKVASGKLLCISSESRWMRKQVRTAKVSCRPEFE